ncbi:hypothetical protein [Mucilaginibacter sp. SJ]|uniref:hypothetical protein n=1 Tax=Mucilaginibacter sp. SJ TaxID=3029053 RepID=UPI0023A97F6C|nr:hypothetical protein [Mucilaginibacter sp. SJ]WEA02670.1 hypothetical protein MusilaSJ_06965 [Mucilaginibacter sp. SJ]
METNHSLMNKGIGKGKNTVGIKPTKKNESQLVKITKEEIDLARPSVYKYLLP